MRKISVPNPILFTKIGYNKLLTEKKRILEERVLAVSELQRAREMGDLKENGFYRGAKNKLISLDRRLRELTHLIRYGKIIEQVIDTNIIKIGTKVKIQEEKNVKTFTLVGEFEANPSENKLSYKSPIGKELLGKKIGDTLTIQVPSGEVIYTILSISLT